MADYYSFRLKANQPTQAPVRGRVILLDDTGVADGIDITPIINGAEGRTMPSRKKAFKCTTDYDGVVLQASVDTTVSIFLSANDVSLGFADGALVNVLGEVTVGNDPGQRVPVDIGGGNVQVTATAVGINNTEANPVPMVQPAGQSFMVDQKAGAEFKIRGYLAGAVADIAPVAVTEARPRVVDQSPTRRGLRLRNSGLYPVGMGGQNVTMANAVVLIQPGEVWNENEAPGAAWYCVTAAGQASTINIQTIE